MSEPSAPPSFFARVAMAFVFFFRILFKPTFAQQMLPFRRPEAGALPGGAAAKELPRPGPPPEKVHASALFLLSMLQRDGRFVDFLQEDIAAFSDEEVGAASRVVHEGCRKVVRQYLTFEPVLAEAEGAEVTVPNGFDPQRIRLTGNVAGTAPYRGSLRHHGWVVTEVKLPEVPQALDPKVIAPAEVELP